MKLKHQIPKTQLAMNQTLIKLQNLITYLIKVAQQLIIHLWSMIQKLIYQHKTSTQLTQTLNSLQNLLS